MKTLAAWMGTAAVVLSALTTGAAQAEAPLVVDAGLPAYRPADSLKGEITICGSDAMTQVAAAWSEQFRRFHPDVKITLTPASSSRAIMNVRDRKADFGLLSREVLPEEVAEFESATGHKPAIMISSMERIAVLVHADNPVEGLTIAELDAMFSADRLRGGAVSAWSDLGVKTPLGAQTPRVLVRDETTGAPATFRSVILQGADFRQDVNRQESYINLVRGVAADQSAIGFAGTMYLLRGIRAVPIAIEKGQPFVAVDSAEADAGAYPLVRPQHMVYNLDPANPPSEVQKEFLRYIFSQLGQEDVVKSGFDPVPAAPAKIALEQVGLSSFN
ncbi:MAG: substrate-binding domain-containing protein [Planctomyces sp.]|nr:substrate-binding domain-containing protein [Planctomyces sp.]